MIYATICCMVLCINEDSGFYIHHKHIHIEICLVRVRKERSHVQLLLSYSLCKLGDTSHSDPDKTKHCSSWPTLRSCTSRPSQEKSLHPSQFCVDGSGCLALVFVFTGCDNLPSSFPNFLLRRNLLDWLMANDSDLQTGNRLERL